MEPPAAQRLDRDGVAGMQERTRGEVGAPLAAADDADPNDSATTRTIRTFDKATLAAVRGGQDTGPENIQKKHGPNYSRL